MYLRVVYCLRIPGGQPLWQARIIEDGVIVGCSEEDELDALWTIEPHDRPFYRWACVKRICAGVCNEQCGRAPRAVCILFDRTHIIHGKAGCAPDGIARVTVSDDIDLAAAVERQRRVVSKRINGRIHPTGAAVRDVMDSSIIADG